jgi:hypothetical protein
VEKTNENPVTPSRMLKNITILPIYNIVVIAANLCTIGFNVAFLSFNSPLLHRIPIQGSPYEVICITATVR